MDSTKRRTIINNILIALLVGAVCTLMYLWLIPDKDWEGIKVVSGQTQEIKLPDGSMATLTGPSSIGYPKTFDKDIRKVKMEGEIYFDIVNNPNQTFLIQTELGGLETHGASVKVNTKEKDIIIIDCLEDSVRAIARGKKDIFEIELLSNEMIRFHKKDTIIKKFNKKKRIFIVD